MPSETVIASDSPLFEGGCPSAARHRAASFERIVPSIETTTLRPDLGKAIGRPLPSPVAMATV
jgi:hypothetical protein